MHYTFRAWVKDILAAAGGKFTIALAVLAAILTVVTGSFGPWKPLFWFLPVVGLGAVIRAAFDVHRRALLLLPGAPGAVRNGFDAFIAAPMASTESDSEYSAVKAVVDVVVRRLRQDCGLRRIYWAGEDLDRKKDFDPGDRAYVENFTALIQSRVLIVLFPRSIPSSILVEAGYAFAHRIPTLIFVQDTADLPYALQQLSQVHQWVKVYSAGKNNFLEHVERILTKHGDKILHEIDEARQALVR